MPRTEKRLMDGWKFAMELTADKTLQQALELEYRPVILPHDWAVESPFDKSIRSSQGFRDRFRCGWYLKTLELSEVKPDYCYLLDFDGVFENSTVWVNGKEAGGCRYGYSPFRLDVTEFVCQGENQIVVKVDNTAKPADRWLSAAGIYRTVRWIEVEKKHLDEREVVVHTSLNANGAKVQVYCGVQDSVRGVLTGGDQCFAAQGEDGKLVFNVPLPRLWSAEHPELYTLAVSLLDGERETDTITLRIGIREVVMDPDHGLFVNGEHVTLKGVCLHQDVGSRGNASKKEIWRERLIDLKETGCNALRLAHHLYPREFLDLCDEMGFYVYEECFDKWQSGLYGRYFDECWQYDVAAMVKRDRNRPSIIIWGVGNEVENQAQRSMLQILKMLREYLLTLDDTRPVSVAMNPHFKHESGIDARKVDDIQQFVDEVSDTEIYDVEERIDAMAGIAALVDIICCNYQEQWYERIRARFPDKLILGTEVYEYFMGHPDQMKNHTVHAPALVPFEKEYVIGSMQWTGIDYLGESMGYPYKGWCGTLMRTTGDRRFSYYLMKSYWSEEPVVRFAVMDYSLPDEGVKEMWDIPPYVEHWHFPQFRKTVIPYAIASNCDEVRLTLNGTPYYLPKPSECPNRMITGFLPYQPGTVEAVGLKDGKEVCRHVVVTPGYSAKLVFETPERQVPAEAGYELLLRVRAQDIDGNPCFRESAKVNFRVEGPAQLLTVDNGDLSEHACYQSDSVHLYRGCAAVLIRLDGNIGSVKVFADAPGMFGAQALVLAED